MHKSPAFAALFSTFYLLFYTILAFWQGATDTVILLFLVSPLLVIWLVYTVVKFGRASGRTADEYFYDDSNLRPDQYRR